MFWSITPLSTCSFSSFAGEQVGYFYCQNNIIIVSDFSAIHCISVLPSKIRVALNCHASHNITVLDIFLKRPSLHIICIANSYVNDLNNFWVPFILDAQFGKKKHSRQNSYYTRECGEGPHCSNARFSTSYPNKESNTSDLYLMSPVKHILSSPELPFLVV